MAYTGGAAADMPAEDFVGVKKHEFSVYVNAFINPDTGDFFEVEIELDTGRVSAPRNNFEVGVFIHETLTIHWNQHVIDHFDIPPTTRLDVENNDYIIPDRYDALLSRRNYYFDFVNYTITVENPDDETYEYDNLVAIVDRDTFEIKVMDDYYKYENAKYPVIRYTYPDEDYTVSGTAHGAPQELVDEYEAYVATKHKEYLATIAT